MRPGPPPPSPLVCPEPKFKKSLSVMGFKTLCFSSGLRSAKSFSMTLERVEVSSLERLVLTLESDYMSLMVFILNCKR